MRRASLIVAVVAVVVLVCGGVASAITYGQPDGNRHPNVGALVGTFDGQKYPYCSGTLISPTVFLTAAHCGETGERVYVTFDSEYSAKSKLYSGTFYAHPSYPGSENKPIRGIEPAQLPTLGQFDTLAKDQQFTAVGYGGQEAVNQPGGPVIGYLDTREYAVSTLNAVGPSYLRLSQNPATSAARTSWARDLPRRTSSRDHDHRRRLAQIDEGVRAADHTDGLASRGRRIWNYRRR